MSKNYTDTISMYADIPLYININFTSNDWKHYTNNKDKNLHYYFLKTDHCCILYLPYIYGYRRIYVTFSLPKLYKQSNSNSFNITDYDNDTFKKILVQELSKGIDVTQLPPNLKDWQPSRVDLFCMRPIDGRDEYDYFQAYGRLNYRNHKSITYLNTNYSTGTDKLKPVGVLLRMYNKEKEIMDKKIIKAGGIPPLLEEEQDKLMSNIDMPPNHFRYEFASTRRAMKYRFDKLNIPLNMETVMDENIQKQWFNDLIKSRGLDLDILNKSEFRKAAKEIFPTKATYDNAITLTRTLRNPNNPPIPLSKYQQYNIKRKLKDNAISTATSDTITITGLDLSKCR